MARHRQPREVAELKGAIAKNPKRYQNVPPRVDMPIGDAPAHLSAAAKSCWFEIASYAPRNVLTGADRLLVEMMANLLAEYRADPDGFAVGKYTPLRGGLAQLGMTPSDRQKLGTEKAQEANPFAEFV